MKAVLALAILYVVTFLIVIQGASQNFVKAVKQDAASQTARPVDPLKETDIRSLMELLGVRDVVQDSTTKGIEQFREKMFYLDVIVGARQAQAGSGLQRVPCRIVQLPD